ncbi:hypothetical protein MRB53_022145 [Persea americana]|uniref:Uncharacterized protein n=1 Tax=Persea americana TaxID=3435 RepID=A0ACC2L648_PERAE|nr:hypothetical protein MRB53_022145 [Persea americana]
MGKPAKISQEEEEHIFRSRFPAVPVPENKTLPEFVLEGCELFSEKVALVDAITGKEYTYGQLHRDTHRFAKALRSLGLRKGGVVVVLLPNMVEYATIVFGIMTAGGVFSGANPQGHSSEIKTQVESSEAKLIVTNGSVYEKVKDLGVPVIIVGQDSVENTISLDDLLAAADQAGPGTIKEPIHQTDLCALPFSSGTTGTSKGVMLTHRNVVANLCSSLFTVSSDMVGQVTILGLMPFFHIYGATGICCAAIRNKGKVVVMGRFDLRTFMDALIKHQVHFAPIVPPIMLALIKNPIVQEFDLSRINLKAVMTAAAPLAPDLQTAFEEKFPGVQIEQAYGLTEHSCVTLTHGDLNQGHGTAKKNSVGFILPNLEMKVTDPDTGRSLPVNTPGELCIRSECVMQGYYKNKEETDRTIDSNGWLHTGDIGYIDEDGDVFIVDRIKEMIKYKGFQVAPAELEAVLLSHPSIEDAAVIALPDEEAGEIPSACVVMRTDAKENEEDIMKYVASTVATYKRVRVLHFVDKIPKSPSGKIMRRLVKETMLKKLGTAKQDGEKGAPQNA